MSTSRKLAAILSADVAGYSRLMAEDEQATLATLNDYRAAMSGLITKFRGRVIDAPGDALLAEFLSAVEAVQCAAEIQQDLAQRNAQLPESRRMLFRIGVNLGDVIEQDGALYGDGVNIAARLEALAEPGGVCISGTVFDQVEGKVTMPLRFAGEQSVKNIAKPVRAYFLGAPAHRLPSVKLGKAALIAFGIVLACGIGVGLWLTTHTGTSEPSASAEHVLAMPKGPVVAVLPFTNMSGDPGQDYFSDGLSEDIITELARFREVHVLARNTTFQYKGQSVDVPAVGRKLGAQYVLEGSVRRAENQLRINVQLIDVASGGHIWAERFDRRPEDVFAVQDEVTRQIVGAIAGGSGGLIHDSVMRRARTKKLEQMEAYELVLQARIGPFSQAWYDKNKAALERAIALDPNFARARDAYAWLRMIGWIFRFDPSPTPPEEILENAVRAVQLDPHDAHAHRTAAYGYYFRKQFDAFERAAMTALQLTPYNASIYAELGILFTFHGQWERGIALIDKAHTLNAESASGWSHTAWHYDFYRKGEYQKALDILFGHPAMEVCETQWKFVAAYGQLGQPEKARQHWDRCKALVRGLSTDFIADVLRLWNFQESFIQHYMEGFRKAGHPCQFQGCRRPQHSMSGSPSVPPR